jgi:hypothetical protein
MGAAMPTGDDQSSAPKQPRGKVHRAAARIAGTGGVRTPATMALDPEALEYWARINVDNARLRRMEQRVKDAVADDAHPPQAQRLPAKKRGRPPVIPGIIDAMRKDLVEGRLTKEQLRSLSETAQEARYGASRNTRARALKRVLGLSKNPK